MTSQQHTIQTEFAVWQRKQHVAHQHPSNQSHFFQRENDIFSFILLERYGSDSTKEISAM